MVRLKTALLRRWRNIYFPGLYESGEVGKLMVRQKDYESLVDTDLTVEEYLEENPALKTMSITIPKWVGKNKSHFQDVVPMAECRPFLEAWREETRFAGDDDLLFPMKTGTVRGSDQIRKFHREVIGSRGLGITREKYGLELTPYSYRHTYATWTLLFNDRMTYDNLARNMDTSATQIVKHYSHVTNLDKAEILANL